MPCTQCGYPLQSEEPRLIRCENGRYLAVSRSDCFVHIGVEAPTAERARAKFAKTLNEWRDLLREPFSKITAPEESPDA